MRRFMIVMPVFLFPFFSTFETGFLIYLTTSSLMSFVITLISGRKFMKKILKIPDFLPGTKLEKLVLIILK
jgi:membrane protein insertase Oxa1/YidC/SpoIIIJ